MLVRYKNAPRTPETEITPEPLFLQRRTLIKMLGATVAAAALPPLTEIFGGPTEAAAAQKSLSFSKPEAYQSSLTLTPEEKVISYNNFYEFGSGKDDPAENAKNFKTDPWQLVVDGEVEHPLTLSMEDIFTLFPQEERIYRLRCVEAWSMVVPWIGFSLNALIEKVKPRPGAQFVSFQTFYDSEQMVAKNGAGFSLRYPYVEGLRLDEARHPLTMLVTGVYGKALPPQSGAPIRLMVPWKYGFKSAKSLARIQFLATRPATSWNLAAPNEYGFYANVNPLVSHPRWSQATERFLGSGGVFSAKRQPTLPFNGYEQEVGSLYAGMDLRKEF